MQNGRIVILNSSTGFHTVLPLSPSLSEVSHSQSWALWWAPGWRSCIKIGGRELGVLFLEDPPFGFPSVWQWGRADLPHNLCVQNADQGSNAD